MLSCPVLTRHILLDLFLKILIDPTLFKTSSSNYSFLYYESVSDNCWHFNIYEKDKFWSQLSRAWKKSYNLGARSWFYQNQSPALKTRVDNNLSNKSKYKENILYTEWAALSQKVATQLPKPN